MKRTMNRLFARLAILCIAIILGAVAVSQAQKGLQTSRAEGPIGENPPTITQPIPETPDPPAGAYNDGSNIDPGFYGNPGDSAGYQPVAPAPVFEQPPATPAPDPVAYEPAPYQPAPETYIPEETYAPDPLPAITADVPDVPVVDVRESDVPAVTEPIGVATPPPLYGAEDFAPEPDYTDPAAAAAYLESDEPDYGAAVTQHVDPLPEMNVPPTNMELPPIQSGPIATPTLDSTVSGQAGPSANATGLPPIDMLPVPASAVSNPNPNPTRVGYPAEEPQLAPIEAGPVTTIPPTAGYDTAPAGNNYGGPALGAAMINVAPERRTASSANSISNSTIGYGDTLTPAFNPAGNAGVNPVGANLAGNGRPGPTALEGPQSPTLVVTKKAPPEVQVGKVAEFEVTVRNVGSVDAQDVVIRDQVPQGTRLEGTVPAVVPAADGSLAWRLGVVKAGAEVTVMMKITPTTEGDIGSVATVAFQAAASARSVATRPQITLEHTGPGQVLVGDDVIFHIKLSNPGSGVANNVVVVEDVPRGLRHIDGQRLEYQIGTMRPGETRLLELTLKADQRGVVDNLLIAKADSNLRVEDHCRVEIIAPNIQVGIEGPRRRYLDRKATYQVKVANPGTAAANGVELVARLPRGLKFVSTNNAGQYNSQNHSVTWRLAELPAKNMGIVELQLLPEEIGDQRIHVETRAEMGLTDAADHDLRVEGLAAILFTVADAIDPIEVNEQTSYDVRVVNQGSKIGTNVRVVAAVPPGMTPVSGEGPTRVTVQGQNVIFDPLPRLAPQAEALYKVHVKGVAPGDHRIVVQLTSDDVSKPVNKEESTHVYSDQ